MKFAIGLKILAAAVVFMSCTAAHAVTAWNESSNGDLSGDWLAPTTLILSAGSNIIIGSTGNNGQGVDRDYFNFTLPVGATLISLKLLGNTAVSGGVSFIGFQNGAQFTSPATVQPQDLIGFAHYGNDLIGIDMLPSIIFGFNGALASGTYTVWVQDTGGPATYGFDFGVTSVPLPGAGVFLLSGLLGLTVLRRR
jgi:hypothetical protein